MSTAPIFNSALFNPTVERGIQGQTGPIGPTGPQGIQGPPGAATGLSTGADLYPRRLFIQTTGTLAAPSLTLPGSLVAGLTSLGGGVVTAVNGVERFRVNSSGAYISTGTFAVGANPSALYSAYLLNSTSNTEGNQLRLLNTTHNGRSIIHLEATGSTGGSFLRFAQAGLFGINMGIDGTGSLSMSIGNTPAPTGGNGRFVLRQNGTVTIPSLISTVMTGSTVNAANLISNDMTYHGIHFSGNTTMIGDGGTVMNSSPVSVPFTCQRVGRQVTITLGATSFSCSSSGNVISVDYETIILNSGLTEGSIPIERGNYNSADMFMTCTPVVLSNVTGFRPAACYITSVGTGVLSNMRIYIVPENNFITIGTHWMLGVSFTYTAVEDYA